ncbi:Selenoprotein H [Linum grandiflorum]
MAPKKQPSNGELLATRSATAASVRVTRSQAKGGNAKLRAPILASPKRKKAKTAALKKKKKKDEEEEEDAKPEVEKQPDSAEEQEQENPPHNGEVQNDDGKNEAQDTDAALGKKTIVVEHCKQCRSFKVRADQVKVGLEKAIPGIVVELNPEKPRRGCFEVREEGGEVFISLENMPRPFKKMKDLDMDEVVADIVSKIK